METPTTLGWRCLLGEIRGGGERAQGSPGEYQAAPRGVERRGRRLGLALQELQQDSVGRAEMRMQSAWDLAEEEELPP